MAIPCHRAITRLLSAAMVWAASAPRPARGGPSFPLKVSVDGRQVTDQAGRLFPVVGDEAGAALIRLTEAEGARYLDERARSGFNAIMINLLDPQLAADAPGNRPRTTPFMKPGYFERPNPTYFDVAHRWVERAARRGMSVWLWPARLGANRDGGNTFQEIKAGGRRALQTYAHFVAERFRDLPNVVWVVGGDFAPPEPDRWTVTVLAATLKSTVPDRLIMAWGGPGESAGLVYRNEPWLDVTAVFIDQLDVPVPRRPAVAFDPVRPVVVFASTDDTRPGFPLDERRCRARWLMEAGACGQFLGTNPIWHGSGPGLFDR